MAEKGASMNVGLVTLWGSTAHQWNKEPTDQQLVFIPMTDPCGYCIYLPTCFVDFYGKCR